MADRPVVLYASLAYFLTVSALFLNSVSTPPIDCCSAAPSLKDALIPSVIICPILAAAMIPASAPTKLPPNKVPALVPALDASGANCLVIDPCIPLADGIICTYACPNSVAIYSLLSLTNLSLNFIKSSPDSKDVIFSFGFSLTDSMIDLG